MVDKFKDGDIVDYDFNHLGGVGCIVGVSTTHNPVLGRMWIIEDLSDNIPNETYKFKMFVCPEINIEHHEA